MIARLSPCRQFVEMQGERWSERFAAEHLPARLRFYRGLRDRARPKGADSGPYHRFYARTVIALEQVAAELQGPTLPGGGGGARARVAA